MSCVIASFASVFTSSWSRGGGCVVFLGGVLVGLGGVGFFCWFFLLLSVHHSYSYKPGREYNTRDRLPQPCKQLASNHPNQGWVPLPLPPSSGAVSVSSAAIRDLCHAPAELTGGHGKLHQTATIHIHHQADRAGHRRFTASRGSAAG